MSQAMSNAVCFPRGFKANGIHCGVRKNRIKKDLALIYYYNNKKLPEGFEFN